ncbi:MAG: 5'/3'-nucleotidase SurE [Fibrobacter sp.]|nr:5'/3'-nucleotidase SurE [Fibrobacter sp.]
MRKPRILITNDDGVNSANIRALAGALAPFGEVFVFAPEHEQSGVSQAFTVRKAFAVKEHPVAVGDACESYRVFSVDGTPADAAKFALGYYAGTTFVTSKNGVDCTNGFDCAKLDVHGKPTFDVCFSGVNVGENSGVSSLYSGTVAGAREAALWGVPAVALSLSLGGESLMGEVLNFAKRVVTERMFESIPLGTFWNVNFPKAVGGAFKGYRATTMALGMFTDHYDRQVADGNELWQLDGEKLWDEAPVESDDYLLHQGYATVTPHRIDQTDPESLKVINEMLVGGGEA